ncbi:MXAN_6230/SCO0854 family RING domain-containing protein [Micromonospora sp. NPDC003197]
MSGLAVATWTTGAKGEPLAAVLLRRTGLVAPGLLTGGGQRIKQSGRQPVSTANGLLALEADLLSLGWLLGPRLRDHLAGQTTEALAAIGLGLLATLENLVGADVPHVPLFRKFPRSVPADTYDLYLQRVFTLLRQEPDQPCVHCARTRTVRPVAPCAHLICDACWDMTDYSGCPLCHGRIDLQEPFLPVAAPPKGGKPIQMPRRAAVLELAADLNRSVHQLINGLLDRHTPLTPQDRTDLTVLLNRVGHGDLGWLPDRIPVRETRATVLGRLVADPALADRLPELLATHVDTATDVLRLLYVLHGGDPGLVDPPQRHHSLPRRVRRALLDRLDALPLPAVAEDLRRHRVAWLHAAEQLHPFEQAHRHPRAAVAFAVLRRTTIDESTRLGRLLAQTADKHSDVLRRAGNRLRLHGWAGRVETAMATGDLETTVRLAAQRPGELLRRLVALAGRTDDGDALVSTVGDAVPAVAPGVLLAALGAVRAATWPANTRLYFPRGGSARLFTESDRRPRLSADLGGELDMLLADEFLARAGSLPPVETALLDAALVDLVAPFTERTAAPSLVRLPRGSRQPLPTGRIVRLFVHWTEPAQAQVDLDLSVAMFDNNGHSVGWCDYTELRYGKTAAVHSGDLTSAPAPLGASEFVDLDLRALRKLGIRYLTMIVFSYNDVPFEAMTDAFAGFMGDPGRDSRPFEPKAVEQRFDLTGNVRIATPLLVDLQTRTLCWVDATLGGAGGQHNVARYAETLGRLTTAVNRYFTAGHRVSLWEVACWHAAARTRTVHVRDRTGSLVTYRRGEGESVLAFASRLTALGPADGVPTGEEPETASSTPQTVDDAPLPGFAALVRGDVELADGAQVYALHRAELDANRVDLLDAAQLVGLLTR